MNKLSQQLVEIASNAALKVGDMLVKASAEALAGGVSTEEKEGFYDLVTKYDREAEQAIADHIFQSYPDSTIVGEEGGAQGDGSVHWYVDPIDGTSNFASGIPFFSVSIGAVLDDRILAGVIYAPIRRELFSASTVGAFLNGEPIKSQGHKTDSKSLLVAAFPNPREDILGDDGQLFTELVRRFSTVRRLGSAALGLAYVACGRADVVFEPIISPWDVTAGILLIEQAGGRYVPLGEVDSHAQSYPWLFPGFIATCAEFDLEQSIMNVFVD